MPQIDEDDLLDFLEWLRQEGIHVRKDSAAVSTLKPTQLDMNVEKVRSMMTKNVAALGKPLVVASDDYIMDGHHRWAALVAKEPTYILRFWRVHLPIRPLLLKVRQFDGVEFRTVHEALRRQRWPTFAPV